MSPDLGLEWVAYAGRVSVQDVMSWGLTDAQLVRLGAALSSNKVLNPPRHIPVRVGTFVCACGCGTVFQREYKTRRPKYLNRSHQMRAYRKRRSCEIS